MPRVLRPIGYEDRLSVIDHLDELRTRLITAGIFVVAVFIVCFIFNHQLLSIVNKPLSKVNVATNHISAVSRDQVNQRHGLIEQLRGYQVLLAASRPGSRQQAGYGLVVGGLQKQIRALPKVAQKDKPITIGIGEPFTTTLTVVAYFALLISLPMLLYQLYAFVIPALAPQEQRVARPVMMVAPILFVAGVVFTYYAVLPPAVKFLQGYNSSEFDSLVQAAPYYKFEILVMLGIGLAFQVPLGLLALQRVGAINAGTLTGNWRYAILIITVIVALLPGVDPVTMAFEMAPLVLLYLASIVLLKIVDHRDAARARRELADLTHLNEET